MDENKVADHSGNRNAADNDGGKPQNAANQWHVDKRRKHTLIRLIGYLRDPHIAQDVHALVDALLPWAEAQLQQTEEHLRQLQKVRDDQRQLRQGY